MNKTDLLNDFKVIKGERKTDKLPLLPLSNPIFTIILDTVPSWNEIIYLSNPFDRSKMIKKERARGYQIGIALAKVLEIPLRTEKVNKKTIRDSFVDVLAYPVTGQKIFCYLEIWRERGKKDASRSNRVRDVYNAAVKALIDGLTDAGVWTDDSEDFHTDFWIHYAGLSEKPRVEIKFYENKG